MITNGNIREYQNRHGSMVDLDLEIHIKDMPEARAEDVLDIIAEFKFRLTAPDTESPKAEKAREKEQPKSAPKTAFKSKLQIPYHYKNERGKYDAAWKLCKKHGCTYPEALKREQEKSSPAPSKQYRPAAAASAPAPAPKPEKKPTALQIIKAKATVMPPKKANYGQGWSDDEIAALDGCNDKKAAIAAYRATFPDRKRTDASIYAKFHTIEMRARKDGKELQKSAETVEKPQPAPAPEPVADDPPVKIEGADDPALKEIMPVDRPATRTEIQIGAKVIQTAGPRIFYGEGTVTRAPHNKSEVLVRFGNGMEWMKRENLSLMPA